MAFKQSIGSIKLIPSGGGVFEVSVNEKKLYSKRETGEFPDFDAIFKAVQGRL